MAMPDLRRRIESHLSFPSFLFFSLQKRKVCARWEELRVSQPGTTGKFTGKVAEVKLGLKMSFLFKRPGHGSLLRSYFEVTSNIILVIFLEIIVLGVKI